MTKMTQAQRTAVLDAHANARSDANVLGYARGATLTVLLRNAWIDSEYRPTLAGLIAAGVDVDAIHAEAADYASKAVESLHAAGALADRPLRSHPFLPTMGSGAAYGPCQIRRCGLAYGDPIHARSAAPDAHARAVELVSAGGTNAEIAETYAALRDDVVRDARAIVPEPKRIAGTRGMALSTDDPHSSVYRAAALGAELDRAHPALTLVEQAQRAAARLDRELSDRAAAARQQVEREARFVRNAAALVAVAELRVWLADHGAGIESFCQVDVIERVLRASSS